MRAERGPVQLFDRGFQSIDELKSRCKAETGLDAPQAPTFPERARKRQTPPTQASAAASRKPKTVARSKAAAAV